MFSFNPSTVLETTILEIHQFNNVYCFVRLPRGVDDEDEDGVSGERDVVDVSFD